MNSHIWHILALFFILIFIAISCKDPEIERKIDAHLRLQIKTLTASSQLDNNISIVFKTNEELTDEHKNVLQKQNINITANIGYIYTATLPARALYDLAKMRCVESIQGSRELTIQPPDTLKPIQKF